MSQPVKLKNARSLVMRQGTEAMKLIFVSDSTDDDAPNRLEIEMPLSEIASLYKQLENLRHVKLAQTPGTYRRTKSFLAW